MASVLLLNPMKDIVSYIPYALLFLESHLKANGHQVEIIDFQIGADAIRQFRSSLKKSPDILGISVFLGPSAKIAMKAAAICRHISPKTLVVLGGALPSMYPEQLLADPNVDYVVRFEGEETFVKLIEALAQGNTRPEIPGIGWREGDEQILQPRPTLLDLNTALPIGFENVNSECYILRGGYYLPCKRACSFFTSRGCPYSCNFCYNQYYHQGRWRPFPAEWVLDGIEKLVNQFDVDGLYFMDDNFAVDRKRAKNILEGIKSRGMDLVYWWEMRVDQIIKMDIEELNEFYDLGLRCLYIGAESGSNRLLDTLGKGITVDDIRTANQKLAQANINISYSFMIGLPGETNDELIQTVDLAMELLDTNPRASIWQLNPYIPYYTGPDSAYIDKCYSGTFITIDGLTPPANTSWAHSSRSERQVISYSSKFLKSDVFFRNSSFWYKILFKTFRSIARLRMRKHLFVFFFDTLFIIILFRISRVPLKTRAKL